MEFQGLIDWLNTNPEWLLAGIFLTAFVESLALAGIVVPGVAMLFVIAAAAGSAAIPLTEVLVCGFAGAVLGDGVSYYIGYIFRDRLNDVWPFTRFPKTIESGAQFFQRHGGKSVVVGRFVGPIRPVIPIVAGMFGMSQWRFLSFNIISAIAWAPAYLLPGYLTGSLEYNALPEHFFRILIAFVLICCCIILLFRYLSQKLQKEAKWYDAIALKRESSPTFNKLWSYLTRVDDKHEFPLASLVLFLLTFTLFWVWTWLALNGTFISQLDQLLFEQSTQLRNEWIDPVLVTLTLIGNEAFLYISFIVFVIIVTFKGDRWGALHIACAGLATAIITHGFKNWFQINRPEWVLQPPDSFAYPSGHSSGATIFYGLLASFVAQSLIRRQRWQVYMLFGLPITLIALSRVLLGVHWFSDIVGGILLGLSICAFTRIAYSRVHQRPGQLENKTRIDKTSMTGFVIWLLSFAIYHYYFYAETLARFSVT